MLLYLVAHEGGRVDADGPVVELAVRHPLHHRRHRRLGREHCTAAGEARRTSADVQLPSGAAHRMRCRGLRRLGARIVRLVKNGEAQLKQLREGRIVRADGRCQVRSERCRGRRRRRKGRLRAASFKQRKGSAWGLADSQTSGCPRGVCLPGGRPRPRSPPARRRPPGRCSTPDQPRRGGSKGGVRHLLSTGTEVLPYLTERWTAGAGRPRERGPRAAHLTGAKGSTLAHDRSLSTDSSRSTSPAATVPKSATQKGR
jgi:hypothetical protein